MFYSVVAAVFIFHCMAANCTSDFFPLPVLNVDSMQLQLNVKMWRCLQFSETLCKTSVISNAHVLFF